MESAWDFESDTSIDLWVGGGRPVKKSVNMLCVVDICRLDLELVWLIIFKTALLAASSSLLKSDLL